MADIEDDERCCMVSVLLQRDIATDKWGGVRWRVAGIVPDATTAPTRQLPSCSLARADDATRTWLWRGLALRLSPDACDDYLLNLDGGRPLLFVICQPDADGELRPVAVSADQQDGADALQFEGSVFECDMPAPIAAWIRAWVPQHWKPSQRKGKRWQKLAEEWS